MNKLQSKTTRLLRVALGPPTALLLLSTVPFSTAAAQTTTYFAIPTINSQPTGVAIGSDGNVYFTEYGSSTSKVGVLTPQTGNIEELTIQGGDLTAIIESPDGQVWFTETNNNTLGSIAPATAQFPFDQSIHPLGGSSTGPTVLTLATDGNIWVWGSSTEQLLFRPPTGNAAATRVSVSPTASITALAAGTGGYVWYAGTNAVGKSVKGTIGRHDVKAGVTVMYDASGATSPKPSMPFGIVEGSDGNMWFTDQGANAIGRITPTGAIDIFPLPTANAKPNFIVVGADGAMYFTEGTANQIGRIDTTGVIKEYQLPSSPMSQRPYAITSDPNGPIWFTTLTGNAVGRFDPPVIGSPVFASVLPSSRSVETPNVATVFASIINSGSTTLNGCGIAPVTPLTASFAFQTTDPSTNQVSGGLNVRTSIPAGGDQTFVLAISPNGPFFPNVVEFGYECVGVPAAATIPGVNTLQLTFSATPVADMIAVGLTPSNDGFAHTGGSNGTGLFAIASDNIGASTSLTARARLSNPALPIMATVCQTNSSTAACLSPPAATVTATIGNNQTATWAAFLTAGGPVAADPANNRVFFEFVDSGGIVRGSTSTAVTTQ
jgi:streptogramin lyase